MVIVAEIKHDVNVTKRMFRKKRDKIASDFCEGYGLTEY